MYSPTQDGFSVKGQSVRYAELPPTSDLADVVHCFWELKTLEVLPKDFMYHALPDACVNLMFNQLETSIAGVTALHTQATSLNLGKSFHYVGIQFYPGVWQGDPDEVSNQYVGSAYSGSLPLVAINQTMVGLAFSAMTVELARLVQWCIKNKVVQASTLTKAILLNLSSIRTVADMALLVGLSPRQLQRSLLRLTGFTPHDLLKVLRIQQSFRTHYLDLYADQAHFTNAFREAVGYTPTRYRKQFVE
jgi:AraC-like DNA-binding protein